MCVVESGGRIHGLKRHTSKSHTRAGLEDKRQPSTLPLFSPPFPSPFLSYSCRSITSETKSWATALNEPLVKTDPDLYAIIEQEKIRQQESLVLIASENFTSK